MRLHIAGGEFDRKTADAVLYNLIVIGEAAREITEATRRRAPEIEWTRVVALRNLIAHEYFRVDLDVIESLLAEELDALEESARRLLAAADES